MRKLDIRFFKLPPTNRGFTFMNWNYPCECGCDERLMKPKEKLIGYFIYRFWNFGFTIFLKEVA